MKDRTLVLIIEDMENPRRMMIETLAAAGFRTQGAKTALEGVRLARLERPDLILTDIGLPDQDGAVAMSCLKDYPGFEAIPLVLVSSLPEESLEKRATEAGAIAFLRKPFSRGALLESVKHWIAASRAG